MGESGPEADDLDAGDPFADTDAMERQSDDAADEVGAVSGRASTPSGAAVGESREPQEETTTSESGDNDGEGLQAPQTIPPGKRSPEAVAQLVVPDGGPARSRRDSIRAGAVDSHRRQEEGASIHIRSDGETAQYRPSGEGGLRITP